MIEHVCLSRKETSLFDPLQTKNISMILRNARRAITDCKLKVEYCCIFMYNSALCCFSTADIQTIKNKFLKNKSTHQGVNSSREFFSIYCLSPPLSANVYTNVCSYTWVFNSCH